MEIAATEESTDPLRVERDLRMRLAGRRLIAEIGIDPALYRTTTRALKKVMSNSLDAYAERLANTYPALTATYLVAHGVYQYSAGDYWSGQAVHQMNRDLGGPAFEKAVRNLGLETFTNLLGSEKALRFITPILAHGGIPKYCLDDFFGLLLKDLGEGSADANDLLTVWRTRKTRFQNIDRPVQRFLLHGGELAVDLIDRCIDLVREHSRSGTVMSAEDAGLPSYVVRAFARREDKTPKGRSRPATTSGRPTISLDPWTAQGPQLTLPAVDRSLQHAAWHVQADQRSRVTAGPQTVQIPLNPAPAWGVELASLDKGVLRQTSFEGLDPLPALFFDPDTGRLMSAASGLRLRSVWVLAPDETRYEARDRADSSVALVEPELLPEPTGSWSGYTVRCFDLAGISSLQVTPPGADAPHTVRMLAVGERPDLVDDPLSGVTTAAGLAVFPATPSVHLPDAALDHLDQWRLRISVRDGDGTAPVSVGADGVTDEHGVIALDDLLPGNTLTAVDLVVQGPLGSDLRTSFAVVVGLQVNRPDRLLFPGDKTSGVTVRTGPDHLVNGERGEDGLRLDVPDLGDEIELDITAGSTSIELLVRVPRVQWGLSMIDDPVTQIGTEVVAVRADDVIDGHVSALVVHTGDGGHELTLALHGRDNTPLQKSDTYTASGREGRWVFDLARFRDTVKTSADSTLDFVLFIGMRPVTVARLRASLAIGDVTATSRCVEGFTSIRLDYDEPRAVKDRVLRLWSRDRPWDEPVGAPIPDGQLGFAEISGYDSIPPGEYRAELAIDDGWGSPKRPSRGAPHTAEITVGTHLDRQDYLNALNPDDPAAVLEVAASTGWIARHLDEAELAKVGPLALTAALHAITDDRGHDLSSPRFSAIGSLLTADETCFAKTITSAVTDGRCTPTEATRVALELVDRIEPPELRTSITGEMRGLWQTCPLAAIRFDLTASLSGEQQARLDEFLGWAPDADDPIPTGEPVNQMFAAMPAETLRAIQAQIDLVPRRLLDIDSLVAANFEWLLAASSDGVDVQRWWHIARQSARHLRTPGPNLSAHLESREPPQGTVSWAGVPKASLALATLAIADEDSRAEAISLLAEAHSWAPRLVGRDLVLACLLQWLDDQEVAP